MLLGAMLICLKIFGAGENRKYLAKSKIENYLIKKVINLVLVTENVSDVQYR